MIITKPVGVFAAEVLIQHIEQQERYIAEVRQHAEHILQVLKEHVTYRGN